MWAHVDSLKVLFQFFSLCQKVGNFGAARLWGPSLYYYATHGACHIFFFILLPLSLKLTVNPNKTFSSPFFLIPKKKKGKRGGETRKKLIRGSLLRNGTLPFADWVRQREKEGRRRRRRRRKNLERGKSYRSGVSNLLHALPNHQRWCAEWKLSRNMHTLHTRFCTFGADLHAQSVIINKVSALELGQKFTKSALLVGQYPYYQVLQWTERCNFLVLPKWYAKWSYLVEVVHKLKKTGWESLLYVLDEEGWRKVLC